MEYFFVYGTLRSEFGNHGYLTGAEFVGKATTDDKFKLSANGIPFVSEKEQISNVVGEVYKTDNPNIIRGLDGLEGCRDINDESKNFYTRKKVSVTTEKGEKIEAWLYFCESGNGTLIESGDYADYRRVSHLSY